MMRKLLAIIGLVLLGVAPVHAQITVPNTFSAGTTISSSQMNANFDILEAEALNRTGGTITGNITVSGGVTIDGIDVGAVLGGSGTPTFASLTVSGGLTIGSGSVALVGSDGKINGPLSSTIIDDLSGANLTTLNAANLSSGTVATARLGSGTANSTSFLRGDSTWTTVTGVGKHGVVAVRTGTQGTFGASGEAIAFSTADELDTDAYHDTVTNNTRITIPTSMGGIYVVSGSVSVSSATGNEANVYVRKNGTTNYSVKQHYASTNYSVVEFSTVMDLSVGDYIEMFILDDDSVVAKSAHFSAVLIGQ